MNKFLTFLVAVSLAFGLQAADSLISTDVVESGKRLPYDDPWDQPGASVMVQRSEYERDSRGIPNSAYFYEYDAHNNLLQETYQGQSNGSWTGDNTKKVWTYDSNNRCTSEACKIIDEDYGDEYDLWKHEYTYDSKGNLTADVYLESDYEWELKKSYRTEYVYDAENRLITEYFGNYYVGVDWSASEKHEYAYDAAGNKLSYTSYSKSDSQWAKSYYAKYTYTDGKLTKFEDFYVRESKDVPYTYEEYTYDASGRKIQAYEYYYGKNNQGEYDWIFRLKTTYAYDAQGHVIDETLYSQSESVASSSTRTTYDAKGRVTEIDYLAMDWAQTGLEITSNREYYYEDGIFSDKLTKGICYIEGSTDTITWTIGRDSTLTLSGKGDMPDYTQYPATMPWVFGHMFITRIVIGEGISSVGEYAFQGADKVVEVNFPSTLKAIGDGSFYHGEALRQIAIPDSVKTIGSRAFSDCYELDSIQFGNGLQEIGMSAFYQCALRYLRLPESLKTIEYQGFYCNDSLLYFSVPKGMTDIGERAFLGCENVTLVECYAEDNPFGYMSVYCPKAILYVPKGCKENYKYVKKDFSEIREFGEVVVPKQYVINGVVIPYTEDEIDVYGDGSVKIQGNKVSLNRTTVNGGLAISVDNADVTVSGTCIINGGLYAKNSLTLNGYYDEIKDKLVVYGGIHSNDTLSQDVFLKHNMYALYAALSSSTKADASQQPASVVTGFTYIDYNSFYYTMRTPQGGYYDFSKRMLFNSDQTPATTINIVFTTDPDSLDGPETVHQESDGKMIIDGQFVIVRNGHIYNILGQPFKTEP